MPDKKLFCSSPWLHIRLNASGQFIPCRWMNSGHYINPKFSTYSDLNFKTTGLMEYFNSDQMKLVRTSLLTDKKLPACAKCHYEDSFGKTSGRKKQLYRSKLDSEESFDETFTDSLHYDLFKYSEENNGESNGHPFDLQIDLGNTCNGACIMCYPDLSSRLYSDYTKLSTISPALFKQGPKINCWSDDPVLLDRFIQELIKFPSIDYIHLLGGETLYLESFYTICDALIAAGLSEKIFLGTTTNLTLYSERLENIVTQFSSFHIGLSIESVNPLNDYIRYPAKIAGVLDTLGKFLELRNGNPDKIHLSLRITPNIFSIFYMDEIIQYMCDNNITGESCDILYNPACLRMELIPEDLRLIAISKLEKVIELNSLSRSAVVDTRNSGLIRQVIASVAFSYIDFLTNMTLPSDSEKCRRDLVTFLNGFESLRGNSILEYAPEYEPFLMTYGYKKKN